MSLPARLIALLAAVSAALALAGALLSSGIDSRAPAPLIAGAVVGLAGLLGLVALTRVVFVLERRRTRR